MIALLKGFCRITTRNKSFLSVRRFHTHMLVKIVSHQVTVVPEEFKSIKLWTLSPGLKGNLNIDVCRKPT